MSPEQTENQQQPAGQAAERRGALRYVLPPAVSASLSLSSGRTMYVTLNNISRTGACVVRRGPLEVTANEEVLLDIRDYEKHQSVTLPARVRWVDAGGYNTLVGLVFREGPLLPGTMLDQYFDQTLRTPGRAGA